MTDGNITDVNIDEKAQDRSGGRALLFAYVPSAQEESNLVHYKNNSHPTNIELLKVC